MRKTRYTIFARGVNGEGAGVCGGGREGGTLWSDLEGERVKKYSAIES